MRIAGVAVVATLALGCLAGCSAGAVRPPDATPVPVSDDVLPLGSDLGEGWTRTPTETGEFRSVGLCPAAASLPSDDSGAPEPARIVGVYVSRDGEARALVDTFATSADAKAALAAETRRARACGTRFEYVRDGERSPVTMEQVDAPYRDLTCRRYSMRLPEREAWFGACFVAVGRLFVTATSFVGRDDAVPVAARLADVTRRNALAARVA